ncbi:MAG: hypothetical protein PHI68_07025 [Candidatus Cloacimonetes bacterium]|nr:hypothetical protein [Candidatus Cloacimonadota bacterium]
MNQFGIWIAVFFTFSIFSFLYKDNPFYKFAEQVFVGLSAGYWLVYMIYNILIPNLFSKLITDFRGNAILLVPGILGVLMLLRIFPKIQWISRFPLALVIGTTAGISIVRSLQTNILSQITSTMINPFASDSIAILIGNLLLIIGTICGVYFFYFSKKQEGISAIPSKVGIWFLMISFGASFGYTVMARISLLIGRLDFLLKDWLHLIK